MDMLHSIKLLQQDLIEQQRKKNRIDILDIILEYYSDYCGIPKGRMIHFYGHPDCGKTLIAKNIIANNENLSFLYVSKDLDDVKAMSKFSNVIILNSNVFEDTIIFLEQIEKEAIDIVIFDNFQNMISKEELMSAFTKKLDNRDVLNKYLKKISSLSAKKKFSTLVFNSINLVTNKSRYSYLLDAESVASFCIDKIHTDHFRMRLKITPVRNIMSNTKRSTDVIYRYDTRILRGHLEEYVDMKEV